MKKMTFWRYIMAASVVCTMLVPSACNKIDEPKDDPDDTEIPEDPENPETPEDPEDPENPENPGDGPTVEMNTLVMGETVISLGSVAVSEMGGNIFLAATEQGGLETAEDIFDAGEKYLYILVNPELVGTEIDIMTEIREFSVSVLWDDIYIAVGNGYAEDVTEGVCTVTDKGDNLYEFFTEFTSSDGVKYAVRAEGTLDETAGEAPAPELQPNTFYFDGTSTALGSSALGIAADYLYLAATPAAGLTDLEDIMYGGDDYMYVMISPSQTGAEFDIMTEQVQFTVSGTWAGQEFTAAPEWYDNVESGKCLVEQTGENTYEFSFYAVLSNGSVVGMRAEGTIAEEVNSNTITYNGVKSILRNAFYMESDGFHYVYFTAADVETFDEMAELAHQYAFVMVPEEQMTGKVIDLEGNADVMVGLMDNTTFAYYMATEGTLKIQQTGEGAYEVSLYGAKLSDMYEEQPDATLEIEFAGQTLSVDYAPVKANEATYNGSTFAIESATIEKTSSSVWTIYLTTAGNSSLTASSTIKITMPASCFDTDKVDYGFSQYPDVMEIAYDSKVWNSNTGAGIGTVGLALNGSELEVEFTTYGELSGYFKGDAAIK